MTYQGPSFRIYKMQLLLPYLSLHKEEKINKEKKFF